MDALDRTAEGTRALLRALASPRAAALVPGAVAALARLAGRTQLADAASLAVLPALAAATARKDPALAAGVALGAVARWEKNRHERPTLLGVAGVIAPHVVYARRLSSRGARNDARGWGLRAGVVAAGLALAGRADSTVRAGSIVRADRADRALVAGVGIGGAAVAATSALAGDPALRRTPSTQGVPHGANLLVVSEGLTFLRTKADHPLLAAAEAATQAVGHVLLADGLLRSNPNRASRQNWAS